VLIDKDPVATTNNLDALTEKELVSKANEALEKMDNSGKLRLESTRMTGAKKLRNSGVTYELCSMEAAKWLRGVRTAFMANFGGTSIVKDRGVSVIVEYVLILHNPEALAEYERIECDSRLGKGALISTRWIKPLQRRTSGQCMAHLIAWLRTPKDANQAIREGMIVAVYCMRLALEGCPSYSVRIPCTQMMMSLHICGMTCYNLQPSIIDSHMSLSASIHHLLLSKPTYSQPHHQIIPTQSTSYHTFHDLGPIL